jgi:hypothetical protein
MPERLDEGSAFADACGSGGVIMLKQTRTMWFMLALLFCSGCATLPTGPSVNVLPAPGKPFEQFMAEDALCRQYAEQQVKSPQETSNRNLITGAGVGTVLGAGAGALIGAGAGNAGAGAAIGAGSGLLVGTAAGAGSGQSYASEAQKRYDNTYVQCMYAKGNQVPGVVREPVRSNPPPPPPGGSYAPAY